MLPTELFTQLTVSKSVNADLLEGGAAGVVNLRSARPFDYKMRDSTSPMRGRAAIDSNASTLGERGALIARDTWGDKFGVLLGVAGVHSEVFTTGWEDGNAGG